MKKIIGLSALLASLVLLASPTFASVNEQGTQPAAAQGACTEEAKAPLYAEFTKNRTTDATKAYGAAKKYLELCTQDDQYTAYLKKWVAAYEKESRKIRFQPLLYGDKKYTEAFALGKEILTDDPENLRVTIDLGYSGFHLAAPATKNESFNADSLTYSKKAIQLIEAGKVPESLDGKSTPWAPFKGKEDTLAYLYHGVGRLMLKSKPEEALGALIKALQYETDLRKEPWEYYFIAAAYETGPYARLSADYERLHKGKDETPESKLALENINQIIDRMIDAYARAVAAAGNDQKYAAPKKEWMEGLSTWYKFRHNQSDAGLNETIASVLSKPLPPVPTPITTLPPTTPTTTTPSSGVGTGTATGNGSASSPSVTSTAPKTAPASASGVGTTSAKPKPRNNHRRRP